MPQLLRFLIAGLLNTAIAYAIYLALLPVVSYQFAYAIAYVIGVGVQYLLHCRYVFRVPMTWRGLIGYPPLHLTLYAVGVVLLYVLVELLQVPRQLAPAVVIVSTVPLSFVLSRTWLRRLHAAQAREPAA